MMRISDISPDLVEEILSRVPITSLRAVRSTCKGWNAFSKNRILCKAEPKQQFLVFMMNDFKVCSVRFDLHGILNKDVVVDPSIKEIGNFQNEVEILNFIHCNGLLLCFLREKTTRLVVWNPYLGQTRWIEPSINGNHHKLNMYVLGYDNNKNRNHKILWMHGYIDYVNFEIYDLKSNIWRVLDVPPHRALFHNDQFVSVKGNTYFNAMGLKMEVCTAEVEEFIICFDFTSEKFGQRPSHYVVGDKVLSSVREEQLALLYIPLFTSEMNIWVTTTIEPNAVSWSYFLKVDISDFQYKVLAGCFSIDQEKKLAMVYYPNEATDINTPKCIVACIIGENGYLRKVGLGNAVKLKDFFHYSRPHVCSYLPSLVQINQIGGLKRKKEKRKMNSKRKEKKGIKQKS